MADQVNIYISAKIQRSDNYKVDYNVNINMKIGNYINDPLKKSTKPFKKTLTPFIPPL